uniref:Uncharacterized protein n=1 Tax=Anopheles farauti TaxID=69004 RepID=A0A182QK30_9DIPT
MSETVRRAEGKFTHYTQAGHTIGPPELELPDPELDPAPLAPLAPFPCALEPPPPPAPPPVASAPFNEPVDERGEIGLMSSLPTDPTELTEPELARLLLFVVLLTAAQNCFTDDSAFAMLPGTLTAPASRGASVAEEELCSDTPLRSIADGLLLGVFRLLLLVLPGPPCGRWADVPTDGGDWELSRDDRNAVGDVSFERSLLRFWVICDMALRCEWIPRKLVPRPPPPPPAAPSPGEEASWRKKSGPRPPPPAGRKPTLGSPGVGLRSDWCPPTSPPLAGLILRPRAAATICICWRISSSAYSWEFRKNSSCNRVGLGRIIAGCIRPAANSSSDESLLSSSGAPCNWPTDCGPARRSSGTSCPTDSSLSSLQQLMRSVSSSSFAVASGGGGVDATFRGSIGTAASPSRPAPGSIRPALARAAPAFSGSGIRGKLCDIIVAIQYQSAKKHSNICVNILHYCGVPF